MNNKGIKFFVICIVIVFVFAIAFFLVSFSKAIQEGKTIANQVLESIVFETTEYINHYGFTDIFVQKYTEYVQNRYDIAATIITEDGITRFAYPVSSHLIEIDNFGDPVITGNSPIISVFSSKLPVDNFINVNITTSIYLIHPDKIFNLAKTTFLIILVATALVFAVLIYIYKINTEEKNTNTIKVSNFQDIFENKKDYNNNNDENLEINNIEKSQIINEEENQNIEDNNKFNEEIVSSNYKPLAPNISDPQGLFSEQTGFGWESYFETRLDSELARAASSEQDLALFLVQIKDISYQNHIIPYLSNILLDKFEFRDLIFEFGKNGFAAILPGTNLDRAMTISQDLFTDISGLLINKQMNNKIGIGITTRSLRLITGNRLIEEAKQAINKAFEEQGLPIVAFRVNPEKYRQCIIEDE